MTDHDPLLFATLEENLGVSFQNPALLTEALSHASVHEGAEGHDYERLEFLGDRVLGLVIAEALLARHPQAVEGELALRLNALVCRGACVETARAVELGKFIKLAKSEAQAGGRDKDTILADACEALIAALYLDRGYGAARDFILRFWGTRITVMEVAPKDAKSALQEWAQAQGKVLPRYVLKEQNGPDHDPDFVYEVVVEGFTAATGRGRTRRQAEQEAAQALLHREGVWS